ncbi:YdcH family protein [Hyphomonas pacifica]|uniref:GTP-binding protein n=1 Tax=Hyphomonas pacifica TaxID=1280941 RepID=A0A8B2PRX5_9PROT|nr:DUF465 domain-containing protein [Hyphomonas pacifica]RAN31066.1 hypothetical protein HY3_16985 [Hyphomonas pacifica]RAN36501.1 hypothetical protein HY11_01905 [Hyphomonas pacifica]
MSHTPHDLAEEFPEMADRIRELKEADTHFARLAQDYYDINRQIHRIETDVEPASDAFQNQLRRQRMTLKDELYTMLKQPV